MDLLGVCQKTVPMAVLRLIPILRSLPIVRPLSILRSLSIRLLWYLIRISRPIILYLKGHILHHTIHSAIDVVQALQSLVHFFHIFYNLMLYGNKLDPFFFKQRFNLS